MQDLNAGVKVSSWIPKIPVINKTVSDGAGGKIRDIPTILPCLNASLGEFTYIKDPPSVTFRVHGKLITV